MLALVAVLAALIGGLLAGLLTFRRELVKLSV
jgi:hypothetical protein